MMYVAMTCLWWSAAETAGVSEALSVMDMYCQDSRQKEIATRKSSALEDVTSIHSSDLSREELFASPVAAPIQVF